MFSCNVLYTEGENRTKQNGFRLKKDSFGLDIRWQFFTQRVVRPWHSLPKEAECPISGGAQDQVRWGPGNLSGWVTALPIAWGLELHDI